MKKFTAAFKTFVADESGVTAIEYGLIAALIGVAAVTAANAMGANLKTLFDYVAQQLTNP